MILTIEKEIKRLTYENNYMKSILKEISLFKGNSNYLVKELAQGCLKILEDKKG